MEFTRTHLFIVIACLAVISMVAGFLLIGLSPARISGAQTLGSKTATIAKGYSQVSGSDIIEVDAQVSCANIDCLGVGSALIIPGGSGIEFTNSSPGRMLGDMKKGESREVSWFLRIVKPGTQTLAIQTVSRNAAQSSDHITLKTG